MAAVMEAPRQPATPETPKVNPAGGEKKPESTLQRLKRKALVALGRGEVNKGKSAGDVLKSIAVRDPEKDRQFLNIVSQEATPVAKATVNQEVGVVSSKPADESGHPEYVAYREYEESQAAAQRGVEVVQPISIVEPSSAEATQQVAPEAGEETPPQRQKTAAERLAEDRARADAMTEFIGQEQARQRAPYPDSVIDRVGVGALPAEEVQVRDASQATLEQPQPQSEVDRFAADQNRADAMTGFMDRERARRETNKPPLVDAASLPSQQNGQAEVTPTVVPDTAQASSTTSGQTENTSLGSRFGSDSERNAAFGQFVDKELQNQQAGSYSGMAGGEGNAAAATNKTRDGEADQPAPTVEPTTPVASSAEATQQVAPEAGEETPPQRQNTAAERLAEDRARADAMTGFMDRERARREANQPPLANGAPSGVEEPASQSGPEQPAPRFASEADRTAAFGQFVAAELQRQKTGSYSGMAGGEGTGIAATNKKVEQVITSESSSVPAGEPTVATAPEATASQRGVQQVENVVAVAPGVTGNEATVLRTPEQANALITEIQDEVVQEQYAGWKDKWIDEVCEAYLDKNKQLGPDAQGNYPIPQARGVYEDPLWDTVLAQETQTAQAEGRIGRRGELFRNAITRYRTEKDQVISDVNGRIVLSNGIPAEMARDSNFAQQVGERVLNRLGIAAGLPQDEAFRAEVLTNITNTLGENRTLTEADITKAEADVVKAREDAAIAAKKAEEDNFLVNHEQMAKDWVDTVVRRHIDEGGVLDSNIKQRLAADEAQAKQEGRPFDMEYAERFTIPEAEGMQDDPRYKVLFKEETDRAQARKQGEDRRTIFQNTITRYRAEKDAERLAEIQQKRQQEQPGVAGDAPVEVVQPNTTAEASIKVGGEVKTERDRSATETAAISATREVVAGGNAGEGANQTNGPAETLQEEIAREVANGMTFAGVNRVMENVYDRYVAENPEDAKHYADSDPRIQAALDRQEAKARETTPLQSEASVGVIEPTVQGAESIEPPLTPREQAMQARIDALEAKLESQSKAMEKMAEVLKEMLEKQLAGAKTDEEKKGINALMLLLMGLGFIGSSVTEGVTE